MRAAPEVPGIARRFSSILYELLLLFAIAFVAASLFQLAAGGPSLQGWRRTALWLYLLSVFAAYFLWCWLRGGQTLPMKSWRIRLVSASNGPVNPTAALARFAAMALPIGGFFLVENHQPWVALALLAVGAFNFGWAFFDRDRQFLHDRVAGTRLVLADQPADQPAYPPVGG